MGGIMKTRRVRIVLRNGTAIEITNIPDAEWAEILRINKRWRTGRTGNLDIIHSNTSHPNPMTFDYSDIVSIEMWPGSEEPRPTSST
jgi:hypothetical protein